MTDILADPIIKKEEDLNSLAIYLYRKGLIKAAKEVSNLRADYIGPDGLRDKSWYRTEDSKDWYYWKDSKTDLKNKPLNPDDALRELVNFAYESDIETLPSCEGHVLSDDEAKKTFNKLLRDKKKINNEGLELINTENKKERITFKDPDYKVPFNDPKELVQERYSGYIGLKFDNKDLPEYIYEQISEIDESVKVELEGKTLHIYIDSDSQEKQKELWKEITEIIKSEVETSKKEARRKAIKELLKFAKDPKKGTGKKPKGSGRRLYTDENPKDTVPVKFRTVSDIKETLSRSDFKSKSHARQSQIINLIHQRVRAAYQNAKDPKVKSRLKKALEYAEKRKKKSKEKTKKLKKESSMKEREISSPEEVYLLLEKERNPKIYLDNPMGSKKGFGNKKRELPFDYGEFSNWINPADDMGWDIIIPPSNREQTNLVQVGIVKVNPDEQIWMEKANKKPPVGNDKIIVASNGEITEEDKEVIEDFFSDMWQFKEVIWFSETKKEARKKRISFFRTNLDYGERDARLKEDNSEDQDLPIKEKA